MTEAGGRPAADRVTVLVVTFNSAHCVPALAEGLAGLPHVTVVDNASRDDTAAAVARALPAARWMPQSRNLGFGAANNVGWRAASTEFVLLLNPDGRLLPGALQALVAAADLCPQAAAVAPQLVDRHGRDEASARWRTDRWASRGPGVEGLACVGFASGACLLVRTEAMRRIGGFDEDFFLYYEDDDLCIRLQDGFGPLLFEPEARVQHASRGSVGGRAVLSAEYLRGYHHIQSKFRFQARHLRRRAGLARRVRYAAAAALEGLLRLCLLDRRRAARAFGRVAGALRWRGDVVSSPRA